VRVAFRLAFWELLHAPSVEAALIDVVNRGGDADNQWRHRRLRYWAPSTASERFPRGWRPAGSAWRSKTLLLEALRDIYHPARLLDLVP